jgi:hypothetical protein
VNPVLLHADGTDCRHEGKPQADIHADGGPLCPGGEQVTHVRFNGQVSTVGQAYASLASIAGTVAAALTPLVTAFAELGRRIGGDPGIRALAAYAEAVEEERRRHDEESPPGGREAGTP